MTQPSEPDDIARHAEKMRKRKAARDRMVATKTDEKGLLIVHTGSGKGKTSAALGMVLRALGHGLPVGVVQFINRRRWDTGESAALGALRRSGLAGHAWARGSPGRRRTAPATSPPPAPPGSGPGADPRPGIRLLCSTS